MRLVQPPPALLHLRGRGSDSLSGLLGRGRAAELYEARVGRVAKLDVPLVHGLKYRRPLADLIGVERDPHSLLGKYVLIGITRISADGDFLEEGECHGRIALVDPDLGIRVLLSDGEVLTLPPDPGSFRAAKPGVYRLRSTGEEVVDPDLTTVWTIREPAGSS